MKVLEGKSKDYFGLQGVGGWSLKGANIGLHNFSMLHYRDCVHFVACMCGWLRLVLPSLCTDLHEKVLGCSLFIAIL